MQSTEREQFDGQLLRLCAAFDRPVADRSDAYWQALQKMSLPEFIRVVDFATGEEGPDKLPTTKYCWLLLRKLKDSAKKTSQQELLSEPSKRFPDNIYFFANRVLLMHIRTRGGLGSVSNAESEELAACMRVKREIVREWIPYIRDRDELATPQQFIHEFTRMIDRVSPLSPAFADAIASSQLTHEADAPFDESYAEIPAEWLQRGDLL